MKLPVRYTRPRASRQLRQAADRCALCAAAYYVARLALGSAAQGFCALWLNGQGAGASPARWEMVYWTASLLSGAAALLFPILLAARSWPGSLRLRLCRAQGSWLRLALPVYLGAAQLLGLVAGWLGQLTGSSRQVALPGSPVARLIAFATLCLMPAILEELLFRGLLQGLLRPHGALLSVTAQAVLFALLHGDLSSVFYALPAGLFFGLLAEQSGSILPGMVLHCANNTLSFFLLLLQSGGYGGLAAILSAGCLVVFPAWAVAALMRGRRIKKHIWNPLQPGAPPAALLDCRALLCTTAVLLTGALLGAFFG